MKRLIAYPVLLVLLLSGCGSKPSEQDALRELSKWFSNLAKVTDFKKLDGKSMEVNGVRQYEMEYEAKLEFTDDAFEQMLDAVKSDQRSETSQHRTKGECKDLRGVLKFEQTENGWEYLPENINDPDFPPEQEGWCLLSDNGKDVYYRAIKDSVRFASSAIASLKMIVSAQATWLQQDVDGNGKKDYWTYDVSCLHRMYREDNQTKAAFIAIDLARADAHPTALNQSTKTFGSAPQIENWTDVTTAPKLGYFFRAMLTDAQGRLYNQNEVGNTEFKATNNSRFAFVAYPAEYGQIAKRTFIVNQEGSVYGQDMGSEATKIVLQWPSNNPAGLGWKFEN
jgi:hypothetical protein